MYYIPGRASVNIVRADPIPQPRSESEAPVVLHSRRLACENSVFSVYLDCLEQADGFHVFDYISIIPRVLAQNGITGIAVLPEINGKFGLVRVYRHPLGSTAWELPRGFIDKQESALDATLRELKEELGLVAIKANLVPLGIVAPDPGVIAARVQLFVARRCVPASTGRKQELGHIEARFFAPSELDALIADGEILDPFTLVACLRHKQLGGMTITG